MDATDVLATHGKGPRIRKALRGPFGSLMKKPYEPEVRTPGLPSAAIKNELVKQVRFRL
jgi:hypothetical protein